MVDASAPAAALEPAQELVFTDEQLTLLAAMAGEPSFPGARPPTLGAAAWQAVAGGLAARGLPRAVKPDAIDAVLGVVLFADSSLCSTLLYAPGEGVNRNETLWLRGGAIVRQTTTPDGLHGFRAGAGAAVDDLLAAVLDFPTAAGSQPGPPQALTQGELADAVGALKVDGAPAAAERHPAAAGYVEALADARRLVRVEARSRVGEDRFDGDELTIVESPRHGLWLARGDSSGDAIMLERVTVASAREQVMALVTTPI